MSMPDHDKEQHEIFSRVGKLEQSNAQLSAQVDAVITAQNATNAKLDQIVNTISMNGKTPWANVFAGMSLIALIGLSMLSYLGGTDGRIERSLNKLTDTFIEHIKDGHPRRVEQRMEALAHLFEQKSGDRFYRVEGEKLEKRLERLENDHFKTGQHNQ